MVIMVNLDIIVNIVMIVIMVIMLIMAIMVNGYESNCGYKLIRVK
jgi:hypothetical protein